VIHRLTLRQINENPTLMSDEVFVPAEEVDELIESNMELAARIRRLESQAYNDSMYLADLQAELRQAHRKIEALSNGGNDHDEEARQASGSAGAVSEREDGKAAGESGKR
jgi:hypothetical protein